MAQVLAGLTLATIWTVSVPVEPLRRPKCRKFPPGRALRAIFPRRFPKDRPGAGSPFPAPRGGPREIPQFLSIGMRTFVDSPRRGSSPIDESSMAKKDPELERWIQACKALTKRVQGLSRIHDSAKRMAELRRIGRQISLVSDHHEQMGQEEPANLFDDLRSSVSGIIGKQMGWADDSPIPALDPESPITSEYALFGNTQTIPLPDLIGWLSSQKKDGSLEVWTQDESITLYLEKGNLVHAVSDRSPTGNRLGEILIEQGVLDENELDRLIDQAKESNLKLGDLLSSESVITEEELRRALETQVQRLFDRLFQVEDARFGFKDCVPVDLDGRIQLNVNYLFLESARALDEASDRAEQPVEPVEPVV